MAAQKRRRSVTIHLHNGDTRLDSRYISLSTLSYLPSHSSSVILRKTLKQQQIGMSPAQAMAQSKRMGIVRTERKVEAGTNKSAHVPGHATVVRLENETEEFKHPSIGKQLSREIQQARLSKAWTQKDLASAINEKPQVIQLYESGAAIPNPQILSKLDRVLGVHLPRNYRRT
jgi:putative transcription factor